MDPQIILGAAVGSAIVQVVQGRASLRALRHDLTYLRRELAALRAWCADLATKLGHHPPPTPAASRKDDGHG